METQNAKFSVAFLLFALSTLAFTNAFQSSAYLPSNGHVRSVRNYVNVQQSFPIKPFEKQSGKEAFVFQMAVDSVTLEGLSNYEEDGAWLSEAIKVALDEEWLPQKVHEEIGERVKNIYVQLRKSGVHDMEQILEETTSLIDKAYINGDSEMDSGAVAGKIKALLTERLQVNKESRTTISLTQDDLQRLQREYADNFSRYRCLQNIMEGLLDWGEISLIAALVNGYRLDENENIDNSNVPEEWRQAFPSPPLFGSDMKMFERLEETFPKHPDELDLMDEMIGNLYGKESYQMAIDSDDRDVLSRSVLVKWLFHTHDFLEEFPKL
mmetsp:Transcript_22667/g.29433  ORF Transcript_22667/g.29433 Transcript_22667/m.29433 type:complete len:324 (-) Transcript_22667:132-1103(-)|eukprot:CAMPEP_0117749362 /NCGR_PEP_ID=MMETSP0947-20121206/9688_1 /TAXON_ID=44440 /ORGANISM="Chattonella subsalsa, Strain CCMP2191" /LENGTH=323 /DNA_ID=CAMNT_0005567245 /DNA_START=63 /DNA_END=1034 /DNA_ORIENTATION=+